MHFVRCMRRHCVCGLAAGGDGAAALTVPAPLLARRLVEPRLDVELPLLRVCGGMRRGGEH
eukprot:356384-Chlamydomonas_euryale.AAC.4